MEKKMLLIKTKKKARANAMAGKLQKNKCCGRNIWLQYIGLESTGRLRTGKQ